MFRLGIVAALAGLGTLVTGCGGAGASAPSVPLPIQGAAAASNTNVIIRNFVFQKPAITVPAGTSITWTNQDSSIHTVTAVGGAFDLEPHTGTGLQPRVPCAGYLCIPLQHPPVHDRHRGRDRLSGRIHE